MERQRNLIYAVIEWGRNHGNNGLISKVEVAKHLNSAIKFISELPKGL